MSDTMPRLEDIIVPDDDTLVTKVSRTDNRVDNLYWGTMKDNWDDAVRLGYSHDRKGSKNPRAILAEEDVRAIRFQLDGGSTAGEIAASYGVSQGCINSINLGKTWSHVQ